MRYWEAAEGLVVEDAPGFMWILGALFVFVGALFALGAAGVFTNATDLGFGTRVTIFALGATGVAVGLWNWKRSPLSRVQVNVRDRYVLVSRWGLIGRQNIRVDFSDVAALELETTSDSEGDPVFRPVLRLRSGATVLLSLIHVHDRAEIERVLREVTSRLDR